MTYLAQILGSTLLGVVSYSSQRGGMDQAARKQPSAKGRK
jgi:hypothetical protein